MVAWMWTTNTTSTVVYNVYVRSTLTDVTPTVDDFQPHRRSTVVYTSYSTNYNSKPEALPSSRWYDPPVISPSGRGPVGTYEVTVKPRTTNWRCAPRASARRARFNWRKRPHGSKRRKLR